MIRRGRTFGSFLCDAESVPSMQIGTPIPKPDENSPK
ncbi:hypothetical protein SAMN06265795_10977 [Noviherbaspirillum humi]|uniref:Uncharacterized protein n=1 Tax=Noviherbaspirillum humi TaxID=1688639 RepID=A0A239IEU8_9BURK|nr:hypothetical protein SAMN06265795_10977 [Noviherbaspirillum humi]